MKESKEKSITSTVLMYSEQCVYTHLEYINFTIFSNKSNTSSQYKKRGNIA